MPTKYYERIPQSDADGNPCGCWLGVDIGSVIDEKMDCEYHIERTCATCGESASESTIAHGIIGNTHSPTFEVK